MKKRCQYSTEAIIILSILLLILLSIMTFREDLIDGMSRSYYSSKARATSDLILQTAELVYSQGAGARSIIFISIPDEIVNITLSGNVMVVNLNLSNTYSSFFRTVPFRLNGTIPDERGNYCLLLESYPGYIEVSNFNGTC